MSLFIFILVLLCFCPFLTYWLLALLLRINLFIQCKKILINNKNKNKKKGREGKEFGTGHTTKKQSYFYQFTLVATSNQSNADHADPVAGGN